MSSLVFEMTLDIVYFVNVRFVLEENLHSQFRNGTISIVRRSCSFFFSSHQQGEFRYFFRTVFEVWQLTINIPKNELLLYIDYTSYNKNVLGIQV